MADTIYNALCVRADETTKAWVIENWREPIGMPEDILDKLLRHDSEFYNLWRQWIDEAGLSEHDDIEFNDPRLAPLIEAIGRAQDLACEESLRERLGRRIAAIRKEKGMSQLDLAAATGLNNANISKIESGKYNVSVDLLERIAKGLGATIDLA